MTTGMIVLPYSVLIDGETTMKISWLCVLVVVPMAGNGSEVTFETSDSPYGFALEYCEDKGGLARFTSSEGVYTFSCADDLTKLIRITR